MIYPKPIKKTKGTLTLSKMRQLYKDASKVTTDDSVVLVPRQLSKFAKLFKKKKTKKRMNRVKKTPIGTLKRKADKLMSQYIIARDKKCVICGSTKQLNNGHLISRRCNSVRWDDVNCNCQCYPCNFLHTHRPERYTQWFIKNYGSLMYEDLVDRSKRLVKVNREYLEDIISFIQEKHIILDNT